MRTEEIINKLDRLLTENKGQEAQQLLEESIRQAIEEADDNALLTLINEMIGYMRETSQVEGSYHYANAALNLMERMGIKGSMPYATTLLNIANAYRAGGRLTESMAYYEEVLKLYQASLDGNDMFFASLYNNVSLLHQEMKNFGKAKENLLKALAIVKVNEGTYFEEAVTYANLASTCLVLHEDETAMEYCGQAIELFEAHGILDSHYCAALSSMGTYYYGKGEYEKAAACFKKAMAGMKASLGENEYYQRLAKNLEACERAQREDAMEQTTKSKEQMTGLALCRAYYEEYGKAMIHEKFADYEDKIAVGLCGEGSDCFGYDDKVSRDHDWGPGFAMWMNIEVYDEIGEELQKAYEELPKEFMGFSRIPTKRAKGRVGVCTIAGFFQRILVTEDCASMIDIVSGAYKLEEGSEKVTEVRGEHPYFPGSVEEKVKLLQACAKEGQLVVYWDDIADESLAAAVNGAVFRDDEGTFSAIQEFLRTGMPQEVYYLKLTNACARFAQGAQYNFARMAARNDMVAAELSLAEGMKYAMKILYYLAGKHPMHDKWLYRGIAEIADYEKEAELIQSIMEGEVIDEQTTLVEELAQRLADRLYEADAISSRESFLEFHVDELYKKEELAGLPDEELIEEIVDAEFEAFDKVKNVGGRASCQNNKPTFSIMRKSQYLTWERKMLIQYLYDFQTEYKRGRNLIEEKYGRMMESTSPQEYAQIAEHFPVLSEEKKQIIEAIVQIQVGFMEGFAGQFPRLAGNARLIHTSEDSLGDTSYETYLRGELGTYSDKMLELYGRFVVRMCQEGKNLAALTMKNSAHLYGYQSLEEAEERCDFN
ncbi:MAG: DUF4125 family protein [Lachnospiraceae bacterium]|nr:DUF4125 family protein [Lachnospiraceae bacterium]